MKGISPLIASVLLIAFTVAIASLIMGWMGTFTRATTSNITSQSETAVGCGSASINIVHVYIDGTCVNGTPTATGRIVVKNTGYKAFSTVQGLIANTTGNVCNNTLTGGLVVGGIGNMALSNCSCSGSFSRVVVTTECGGVGDSTSKTSDLN